MRCIMKQYLFFALATFLFVACGSNSQKSIEYFNATGLIVPARNDVEIENLAFKKSVENSKPLAYTKDYKKIADRLNKKLFP